MHMLGRVAMYARFATSVRRLLRHRLTPETARAIVRQRLESRGERFLRLLERGVFGNPRSPYRPLLDQAGCELGDVARLVETRGVEGALGSLHDAGVRVTFEEYKGRAPIVRDGREIPVRPEDFDNPFLSPAYRTRSSGSTGKATRVAVDLDHVLAQTPIKILAREAHGLVGLPTALWRSPLPSGVGINELLRGAVAGNVPRRWFTPIRSEDVGLHPKNRLGTEYVVAMARLCGIRAPRPRVVRLDRPGPLVEWAARTLETEGACVIRCFVSLAMRVALEARRRGVDLTGLTFLGGGEPPSAAKRRAILASGARHVPVYAFTEVGTLGVGCGRPVDGNDLHLARDAIAVIARPRRVPGWDLEVDALGVTTLLPTAPKILLNVESDDCGVLEDRACGCSLEAVGYTTHVRDVRSFGKLTGEGVTLVRREMVDLLEVALPARFGGGPLDYQLREEEDGQGFTRLALIVSPRISLPDETRILEAVYEALARGSVPAAYAGAFWKQGRSVRVRRGEPIWGAGGKFPSLVTASRESAMAPTGRGEGAR